jgi:hypothetical protein
MFTLGESHCEFVNTLSPDSLYVQVSVSAVEHFRTRQGGENERTFSFPGIPTSHNIMFIDPSAFLAGLAQNPYSRAIISKMLRGKGEEEDRDKHRGDLSSIVYVLLVDDVRRFQP